jgi:hypothetical protein
VVDVPGSVTGQPIRVRRGTARFTDGIPAFVDGNPVYRVREAATLPVGSRVLVGGWETHVSCQAPSDGRCAAVLSDVPFRSPRAAALAFAEVGPFEELYGAGVIRATIEPDPNCTVPLPGSCPPRLSDPETVWSASSDGNMAAAPVDTSALIAGLARRFPALDFAPFDEASSCPAWWPLQSFLVSAPDVPRAESPGLPIRLVVVFPTAEALQLATPDLRRALAKLTPFEASNRCVSVPGGVDDSTWVVNENAMVLIGPDDRLVRAQVVDALREAALR